MRIFLTGGTGFLGSHFLLAAMAAGHQVVALRRLGAESRIPLKCNPTWRNGSLTDDWFNELQTCDVFIHIAAYGVSWGSNDWDCCFQTNVVSSINIWRQAIAAGVRRLVIIGSCFEYGRAGEFHEKIPVDSQLIPTTAYSASKAAATMAATALSIEHNIELVVARPFHIYGEGESPSRFWPTLHKAASLGDDLMMTAGEQIRDFTHVSLAANIILRVADASLFSVEQGIPLVVNIGSGKPLSLREFAENEWSLLGAVGRLHLGTLAYRPNEVMRYVPDVTKI